MQETVPKTLPAVHSKRLSSIFLLNHRLYILKKVGGGNNMVGD